MATMFLENLKASFSDFLRPNYYEVTFSGTLFGEQAFGFLTSAATFPFQTYNTQSVFYNNLPRHFINGVDYDPISFTFLVDDGLKVLRFFDSWRKLIMNDGSRTYNYKEEYSGNIEVQLLNRKQFWRAKVNITDAYPVNMENIALGADTNDQIMSLQVSFRYDDVQYDFDDGFSIAGVRDTIFDLAQGSVGAGIDFIKDGVEGLANKIPASTVSNIFGGFGGQGGKFPATEDGLAAKSKEIFSGVVDTGDTLAAAKSKAKDYAQSALNNSGISDTVANAKSKAADAAQGAFNTAASSFGSKGVNIPGGLGNNLSTASRYARDPAAGARNIAKQAQRKVTAAATKKAKSFLASASKGFLGKISGLFG